VTRNSSPNESEILATSSHPPCRVGERVHLVGSGRQRGASRDEVEHVQRGQRDGADRARSRPPVVDGAAPRDGHTSSVIASGSVG
jgi:hypothetical protein